MPGNGVIVNMISRSVDSGYGAQFNIDQFSTIYLTRGSYTGYIYSSWISVANGLNTDVIARISASTINTSLHLPSINANGKAFYIQGNCTVILYK